MGVGRTDARLGTITLDFAGMIVELSVPLLSPRLGGPKYRPGVGVLARPLLAYIVLMSGCNKRRTIELKTFSTLMVLPLISVALSPAIAASASSADSMVTNPKPRDSRVWGSYMTAAFWTLANLMSVTEQEDEQPPTDSAELAKGRLEISIVNFVTQTRDMQVVAGIGAFDAAGLIINT